MFITAKSALIDAGGCQRRMPFRCAVQFPKAGEWLTETSGFSTDYLSDWYCDLKSLWGHARIINEETGAEIFRG